MSFLYKPIDAIVRIILCKSDLPWKKQIFFNFHILFFNYFSPCTTIETIISIILFENEFLLTKYNFSIFTFGLLIPFLGTTIETIISIVYCENDILENFFFNFHVFFRAFLV